MKTAILLHGMPSKEEFYDKSIPSMSNQHWIPWLQNQLLVRDIFTQTPEMPIPYKPQYDLWKKEFEKLKPEEVNILVGHSCGGGFLLRWLSENKTSHETVALVAPWLDPDREYTTDFFDFEIDKELTKRILNLHIFVSSDDEKGIADSLIIIKKSLTEAKTHSFIDKGHFCFNDLGGEAFPELLEVLI